MSALHRYGRNRLKHEYHWHHWDDGWRAVGDCWCPSQTCCWHSRGQIRQWCFHDRFKIEYLHHFLSLPGLYLSVFIISFNIIWSFYRWFWTQDRWQLRGFEIWSWRENLEVNNLHERFEKLSWCQCCKLQWFL